MASVFKRESDRTRTSRWSIRWFDADANKWKERVGYPDKALSLKEGERLELESAKRKNGLTSPFDEHRNRPLRDHLDDFIAQKTSGHRNARHVLQLKNRILRIIDGIHAEFVYQLDPVKIDAFLSELRIKDQPLGGVTRNKYAMTIQAFTKFLTKARRIEADPLLSLQRIESRVITARHPRRALSVEEIGRLLDASERRPMVELKLIRRGKNKGKLLANIRPEVLVKAKRIGANRRLAYLLAVWTGLRRSELRALKWSDVDFGTMPARIRLRADTTKSKRADTLAIHPQLENELRAIRPATNCEDAPILADGVPGMKALRADLRFANIDPGSRLHGFVDLHSLRMTLSTMLAAAGMSQRARQAHLRHTDSRLTDGVYMDEKLLPIAAELSKLPAIPGVNDAAPAALSFASTAS